VNSEELEQSLRTEFESYLKDVFADMRQEVVQFQEQVNAELERHKSQLEEVFQGFSARVQTEKELDAGFKESVVEHMRLARDEGARITATAMEQAEAMQKESDEQIAPKPGISEIRDAINDISTKNTQSSILKALVQHAADFTPRGAFFIIKNEHLVGWRVFGDEGLVDEHTVREVFFPVSAETVLGEAVRSLSAVESAYGTYADDSIYLEKLEFGQPGKMLAIPLVVRERTVAVLYADYGNKGGEVNVEALETLARVASLTVEIIASGRLPREEPAQPVEQSASFGERYNLDGRGISGVEEIPAPIAETETAFVVEARPAELISEFAEPAFAEAEDDSPAAHDFEISQPAADDDFSSVQTAPEFAAEPVPEFEPVEAVSQWSETETVEVQDAAQYYDPVAVEEDFSAPAGEYQTPPVNDYQATTPDYQPTTPEYQFETGQAYEPAPVQYDETPSNFETASFEKAEIGQTNGFTAPPDAYAPFDSQNGKTENYTAEPVEPQVSQPVAAAQPAKSRFSDRNVDLPIEVGEEERRLHNDARRFARLLVSEIKLYNEQKVKEGREASDLYERLREAIDRSREMYDKRVQPPVAARFDYFHYEIVNTLAEGDENRLGGSYPGAAV
jgi:hypothetical protein